MSAADRELTAETLSALRGFAQTHTEFMARLGGQLFNDTLLVETLVLPADAYVTRSFQVAAGAVEVYYSDPAGSPPPALVSTGDGYRPTGGVGVSVVPSGTIRTVALGSRTLSIWGVAGATVSFQVFTAAVRPTSR